jgi:hypothetical protein
MDHLMRSATKSNNRALRPLASLEPPDDQPITARLAGAGSLRRELEALLAMAPPNASPDDYRWLLTNENVASKRSATARLWAWKRLKLRYALDPSLVEHRAFLAGMRGSIDPKERGLLCFLMFARTDRLFREVTLTCVSPHLVREGTVIEPAAIETAIKERAEARDLAWSMSTTDSIRNNLISSLKDFGLLQGSHLRRTIRPRPGEQTTLFAARLCRSEGLTDRQTLDARWFRLLGLDRNQVADLLYAAHRAGILGFRMQADVVELDVPPLEDEG